MHKDLFLICGAKTLGKVFFILYLFLASCSPREPMQAWLDSQVLTLSACEKNKISSFLWKFMIEEGAVYTLFGDKPMTSLLIFTGETKDMCLEGLSKETLRQVVFVEDSTQEDWKVWKKFVSQFNLTEFLFIERFSAYDPLHVEYFLVNVPSFLGICTDYLQTFRERLNRDLSPSEILSCLQNPESEIWPQIAKDSYLMGLLYGYGEENARYFSEESCRPKQSLSFETFPLPVYISSQKDRTFEKYLKQRGMIEKKYKERDFLEVTLLQLLTQSVPSF